MSQENVEIMRRAFEAFNRGDLDAAVADIALDCEYIATGVIPGARRVYRGPEGFEQFASWLLDEFEDARLEIHDLTDAGDQVLASVTNRGRGRSSGAEVSWHVWLVWTLRDGKFVHGQGFTSRQEALEAAGLREQGANFTVPRLFTTSGHHALCGKVVARQGFVSGRRGY